MKTLKPLCSIISLTLYWLLNYKGRKVSKEEYEKKIKEDSLKNRREEQRLETLPDSFPRSGFLNWNPKEILHV